MTNNTLTDFDIADYLDSKEAVSEYLSQVLADGDTDELLVALGHIARAKGMTEIAKKTGLGRESLYKTFQEGTKPKFETIVKVLDAFGVRLKAV
jgi:probable addiction module antidote protein